MFVISTKDTSRVSWVWVCHNESWKKFSLGLIKDQICASVLPGHDWGAGGKIASCAHPESLAAAFWAQDFVSCCCHSALWRHLHNPVVAVSSAMFHCPPSTKGGSVGHPHPQGCAQPELYELCPSPTHCPTFWRTPLLPKQSSPQNTAELPMPEPCSLPGIPQSHLPLLHPAAPMLQHGLLYVTKSKRIRIVLPPEISKCAAEWFWLLALLVPRHQIHVTALVRDGMRAA